MRLLILLLVRRLRLLRAGGVGLALLRVLLRRELLSRLILPLLLSLRLLFVSTCAGSLTSVLVLLL